MLYVLQDDEKEQSRDVKKDALTKPSLVSDKEPTEIGAHPGLDSSGQCIWDSSEVEVLRRVFKAAGDENSRLRSEVGVLQEDMQKMTAERRAQRESLETTQGRLHHAETANRRLQMLVNHLKTELTRTTQELDRMRSVQAERNDLHRRLEKTQLELSTAQSRRDRDLAAAEAKWMNALQDQTLADTAARAQLTSDVVSLTERVEELAGQLSQERASHSRTGKALEHLRVHFSSLPTCVQQSNDELINWTH